jgi:soluble lytic murein transglycosylase-like protein
MYANGRGLARDDAVAASLFARAASKGHPQAQQMLRFVGEDRGNLPACMRARTAQADAMTFSNDVHLTTSDLFASLPPGKRKIADAASKAARHYEIDPRLVLAIIAAESNFQPDALSPKDALGVMQLIPATAARFNVRNRRNVVDNVRGGISYLRWLLSYYEGRVVLAVAAYNAGEKAVDRYRGVPPYRETRDYVRRVRRLFGDETHPYDPRLAEPSPILVRYHAAAR